MRANALSKAHLVLVGLTLLAPAALAPVSFAKTHRAQAAAITHASAGLKKTSTLAKPVPVAKPGKSAKSAKPIPAPAPTKGGKHAVASHTVAKPAANSAAKTKPVEIARIEPVVPAVPAGPEPHVTHNRKVHLEPEKAEDAPRKATSEDFMAATEEAPVVEKAEAAPIPAIKPHVEPAKEQVAEELVSAAPEYEPELYNKRGRLIMPPPLKGSHEILVRQNINAEHDGLERIQDDEDLMRMRQTKMLVALPVGPSLQVDERLPENRRYSRPWTAQFLADMARAHYAHFHTPMQVNSAVRTVEFQVKLIRTNGNAAPADGDTASPHLTGQAVDIAKKGLSQTEIAWMRGYLLPLVQQGKVDVEEEFQQSCFHISVYRKYMPAAAPKRIIVTHRPVTHTLAAAMP